MVGPTPAEAAALLHDIAVKCQSLPAFTRLSLAREREVKGLVEALQVTPPRPSSTDYLGVYAVTASYPSSQAMRALSAGAASECIWALAVLGGAAVYEPETDGLIQIGRSHEWRSVTAQQAADMCWGLATARHCTPELTHLLDQGLLLESLVELKPRQVTALLWGCAILLHQPHAVLRSLAVMLGTGSVSGLTKFGPRQLAVCAWALSVLQQQSTPLFWLIWAEINRQPTASITKKSALMQLHQVAIEAASTGVDVASHDKHGLLEAAKLVWSAEASNKHSKQGSSYVRDIALTVIALGLQYVEEDASAGYSVDISLPVLSIGIEADGPSHRARNTGQPLGPTVMKQRHLHAAGWQLITVVHDDWDNLHSRQQKLQYLQSCIDACD